MACGCSGTAIKYIAQREGLEPHWRERAYYGLAPASNEEAAWRQAQGYDNPPGTGSTPAHVTTSEEPYAVTPGDNPETLPAGVRADG